MKVRISRYNTIDVSSFRRTSTSIRYHYPTTGARTAWGGGAITRPLALERRGRRLVLVGIGATQGPRGSKGVDASACCAVAFAAAPGSP